MFIWILVFIVLAGNLIDLPRFLSATRTMRGEKYRAAFTIAGILPFGKTIAITILTVKPFSILWRMTRNTFKWALPFIVAQSFFWRDHRVLYLIGVTLYIVYMRYDILLASRFYRTARKMEEIEKRVNGPLV